MGNAELYHLFAPVSRKIRRTCQVFRWKSGPSGPRRIDQKFCHLERARGSYATKGESKDPDNLSFTMQFQGILSVLLRPCLEAHRAGRRAKEAAPRKIAAKQTVILNERRSRE